ncbi:hypothetical protein D9619_004002 [Psilocybe cf. subviscida]|uniref:Uncharacterized protein n=1 Tax=Psilocybe cf. subviscida TaxID=2480587 RepID=A0A8H5F827_9AGAR|nr:hypothetical protein D9619_004002 [Psilocybe cf. subviscida]
MSQMFCRERRSWTAKEDQLLREAVQKEDPDNSNPSKWHAIAKHVPNRTNKDCRKRWFAKMASDVVKGGWAPDEDEKLVKGIERYGTRWSLVASVVQTRNSDQCAKRWTDTLNPAIDRTTWSSEADELLLRAVSEHGKVWTKIVKTYFPGRTGLSAKNRYNSITRFNSDLSRSARPRRKSEAGQYAMHRKAESVSSSSSGSPDTPNSSLPYITTTFPSPVDSKPYRFESFSTWSSSSSSVGSDDVPSFRASPITFADFIPTPDNKSASPSPSDSASPYHQTSFDLSLSQSLSNFPDTAHIVFPNSPGALYKTFAQTHGHNNTHLGAYGASYPSLAHGGDVDQFQMFDGLDTAPIMGVHWDSATSKSAGGYKAPTSTLDFSSVSLKHIGHQLILITYASSVSSMYSTKLIIVVPFPPSLDAHLSSPPTFYSPPLLTVKRSAQF